MVERRYASLITRGAEAIFLKNVYFLLGKKRCSATFNLEREPWDSKMRSGSFNQPWDSEVIASVVVAASGRGLLRDVDAALVVDAFSGKGFHDVDTASVVVAVSGQDLLRDVDRCLGRRRFGAGLAS